MDFQGCEQLPNELEQRLRSMIIDNETREDAVSQPPQNVEAQPAIQATGGSPDSKGNHRGKPPSHQGRRPRKEYLKLDLATPPTFSQDSSWRSNRPQQGYSSTKNASSQKPSHASPRGGANHLNQPQRSPHTSKAAQSPRGHYVSSPSRFTPFSRPPAFTPEQYNSQCFYLEQIAADVLRTAEMSREEIDKKERFRLRLERACQDCIALFFADQFPSARLLTFGSVSSGFGMPGSDMDLAFLPSYTKHDMPKVLEKVLLDMGLGARLLTRTRVPILKICELPTSELYAALHEERQKFDALKPEEQAEYLYPTKTEDKVQEDTKVELTEMFDGGVGKSIVKSETHLESSQDSHSGKPVITDSRKEEIALKEITSEDPSLIFAEGKSVPVSKKPLPRKARPWYRERPPGPLDFPKEGVGIQCDINFSNSLGLQNTLLLRCYSYCDVRVRLMVLFVKKWAKLRKINSSYNGTLSSYGYVLMVLHFLVNVVQPPVCPNLQRTRGPQALGAVGTDSSSICEGYDVSFWRNDAEIQQLAAKGTLTHNREPLGVLLRNFFHYYAQQGSDVVRGGFVWNLQVLSLRTVGGILTKQEKGWVGAKTTMVDQKEIRNRYLFAIEDPFELDHNVGRTVTHNGIVAIRDEYRRAWRILCAVARSDPVEGQLMAPVMTPSPSSLSEKHVVSKDADAVAREAMARGDVDDTPGSVLAPVDSHP